MKGKTVHIIMIVLLLALSILSNINTFAWNKIRPGDALNLDYNMYPFVKETILKYHQFPHWIPTQFGGMPFFANSENVVLNFWQLIFLFLPITIENLINIKIILIPFIAGLCMYLLMLHLKFDFKIAFISALIYMNNGLVRTWSYSWFSRADAIAILPLIFLFLSKAANSDETIKYSIIAGLLLVLPVLGGGLVPFLWFPILFICFFGVYLINRDFKKRIVKTILISIIILVVFLGISCIKLFPLLEFSKVSSKEQGFAYNDFIGQHYDITDIKSILLLPVAASPFGFNPVYVGIIGFLLALLSIFYIKKRIVLLFWILAILVFLISTGSFIDFLIWKYVPIINKSHHVHRSMFLWVFSVAILAGYGMTFVLDYLKKSFKFKNKTLNIIFIIIVVLMLVELIYRDVPYEKRVPMDFKEQIEENHLLQYVSKEEGIFRIHNLGTFGIGGYTNSVVSALNLQILYGNNPVWIPEYMNVYLSVGNNEPTKFWGMLNTKYVYSNLPINSSEIKIDVTGLKFEKKFETCDICIQEPSIDAGISGPYLYSNEYYLPRAYLPKNSILIIGEKNNIIQIMYSLMLNEHFNPSNCVIVLKEGRVDQLNIEALRKYSAVFLTTGSISQNSGLLLKSYLDNGGILLPNVVNGSTSISQEEIEKLLDSYKGDYINVDEIPYIYYSPNKQILNISGKKGFIVISEKYFMFEGWKAKIDGKSADIWRADGINSAVYVDGNNEKLELYYHAKSFFTGLYIATGIIVLIIVYLIYDFFAKNVKAKKQHAN